MEGSATVAANDGTHDLQKSLAFQDNLEENDEIAEVSDDKRFQRYHDILGKGVRTVLSSSPAPPRFLHITLCVKQIIESHVLSCRLLCGPARRRSRSCIKRMTTTRGARSHGTNWTPRQSGLKRTERNSILR